MSVDESEKFGMSKEHILYYEGQDRSCPGQKCFGNTEKSVKITPHL